MRVPPSLLFASALFASACGGGGSQPFVDGGVGRVLEILDPPGQQIGLRPGQTVALRVGYRLDDPAEDVLRGQQVHFSITTPSKDDDPGDSTISHDSDATDSNGVATVSLTAGGEEGLSFAVQASAPGAANVEFDVSVSNLQLVTIEAVLVDPLPQPGARDLVAALFSGKSCGDLTITPTLTGASRSLAGGAAAQTTLTFENLLSQHTYALVGRVSTNGELVAYGCTNIDRSQTPPGAHLSVPVPMYAVSPSVAGTFDVETSLTSARAQRTDARFAPVDVLDRCAGHAAQLLLDAIVPQLPPARAQLVTSARGPTTASTSGSSTVACYGATSLDAMLDVVLEATTPGTARASLVTDLDGLLAGGMLRSSLAFTPTQAHADDSPGIARYAATHTAETVTLMLGATSYPYDLSMYAVPLVSAAAIGATVEGGSLTIDRHTLTLGLPTLWADAFARGSLAVRVPSLMTDTWSAWLAATVNAAAYDGKTGCAAVEDLVCQQTGASGCAGTIVGPCQAAVTTAGGELDGVFDTTDAASTLSGACTVVDLDDDLVADSLQHGVFTATGPTAATLAFSGTRSMTP